MRAVRESVLRGKGSIAFHARPARPAFKSLIPEFRMHTARGHFPLNQRALGELFSDAPLRPSMSIFRVANEKATTLAPGAPLCNGRVIGATRRVSISS